MSRERELLKKILATRWLDHGLSCEVEAILAQPEQVQEPVAWMQDSIELYVLEEKNSLRGYVIPLYTAPPKREPFGPEERERLSRAYSTKAEQVAFNDGVVFAEISHGIGGGE